jgi:hypothetical protein
MKAMKRTEIIKHYKAYFKFNGLALDEDDHLHIDWATDLLEVSSKKTLLENYKKLIKIIDEAGMTRELLKKIIYESIKKLEG